MNQDPSLSKKNFSREEQEPNLTICKTNGIDQDQDPSLTIKLNVANESELFFLNPNSESLMPALESHISNLLVSKASIFYATLRAYENFYYVVFQPTIICA